MRVSIDSEKLDLLANVISDKSGEAVPMTLAEMTDAVDGIQTGGGEPNLQSKTATPSETAQTITPDSGYDGLSEVDVAAIPSDYVGSGITRRSSTDLTVSGATVTVPSGYYLNQAQKSVDVITLPTALTNGAEGTRIATLTLPNGINKYLQIPKGYNNSTSYYQFDVPNGTAGTPTATKGTVSNHSISVTPSVTNTTGYITGSTKTGTAVTVTAAELESGNLAITENGNNISVSGYSTVSVNVSGGGGGMSVATATATPSTASASIQFTGLSGEPTSFVVTTAGDLTTGASPYKTAAVVFDGTDLHGQIVTNTSNAQASYSTNFTKTYSNGTLTITGTGTNFQPNQYKLIYTYGGSSANLGTAQTQVGSGATSVTFTGLTDEPDYFSVIFKSDFGTSSGYQRVMSVAYDGTNTYGVAMDSGAKAQSSWSYTYNNGSLTVSSQGTNNGGYFHQPGYYQLTYGVGGTVEPTEIEVEPLSVTTNGTYTAPTGKAYSPVTVNVSGGGGVNVATTTWTNSSTSTVSHQFTGLSGTPKAAFLRCTTQLTRSSSNTYYYIADIVWDGTDASGNYHLRSNGSYNNVPSDGTAKYNVTVGTNSITFSSTATSRSAAPGSFYNGAYELVYVY